MDWCNLARSWVAEEPEGLAWKRPPVGSWCRERLRVLGTGLAELYVSLLFCMKGDHGKTNLGDRAWAIGDRQCGSLSDRVSLVAMNDSGSLRAVGCDSSGGYGFVVSPVLGNVVGGERTSGKSQDDS